jgi:Tfp pilus assembly protein PilO
MNPNRTLIASIIFAAGAFAFFVLVLPEFTSIKNARAALQVRQALIEEKNAGLKNVAELNKQYKTRQADIDKIITFMPEQKRTDQIVSSIQQITSQSGLSLTDITTAAAAETGEAAGYKKIFVSFNVVGQYPSFVNFLKLLEQNLRLYDIFGIIGSLTTNAAGGAQNLVNFGVKLNTYNLK